MKKKMKLMLLVVAMAVIVGAGMNSVSAATLTLEELVEVSYDKSEFNISVYPGNASYSGSWVIDEIAYESAGVFGDGTVLGYRFFNSNDSVFSSYADYGIVAPATATDIHTRSESWANVWTTTDPGVGFATTADYIDDTLARGSGITGTIDISGLSEGTVYVVCGGLKNDLTLTLTMSGAGQTDIQAEYSVNPGTLNKFWVVPFDFSDAGAYETITYDYIFATGDNTRRGRFVGVIIDGPDGPAVEIISPTDGDTVTVSGSLPLIWTNIDPNGLPLYVDVLFGTEPNELHPGYDMELVVDNIEDADTVNVDASDPGTYYWRVDNTIGDANTVVGTVWSFDASADAVPTVEIHTPAMMTWSDNPVTLDATITDSGLSELTYGWTAEPNGLDDPDLTVDFDAGAEDPEVTVTNLTGSMVTVTLTLTAFDEANPEIAEASVEIDVYPDACEMAKNGLGTPVAATDFNADCITNLPDFAELAFAWFDDYGATEAVDR
ncbi:MAG: hypothetical protein J7M40_17145 [Planctomycetes bacterium]|nr:hypothetical protein [Planctomycetota bacterium]